MSTARPFRILGLHHVAVGAPAKQRLRTLWVDLLGVAARGQFVSERENVDEDVCVLGLGDRAVELDLMQPLDPGRTPAVHLPPLNHIGLWVDDLHAAFDWLQSRGLRFAPGGIRPGAGGYDVCFIHPKGNEAFPLSGEGVLIELIQAPPDLVSRLNRTDPGRAEPPQ